MSRSWKADPAGERAQSETAAGVLTLEPVTIDLPVEEIEEVRDLWIEIRHRPDRDLVTAIEVLSPTNKMGEGYGSIIQAAVLDPSARPPRRARLPGQRPTAADEARAAAGRLFRVHLPGGSPPEVRRLWLVGASWFTEHPDPLAHPTLTSFSTCKPSSPPATTAAAMPGRSTTRHRWICRWRRRPCLGGRARPRLPALRVAWFWIRGR